MTVTAKINETTEAFTTIYVTPKTAQIVDTVSITGLADLSKYNTDDFTTLPTLVAETGDDVEYQEETPHSTGWKYYGADGNSSEITATAFDKPGVYKAEYTLKIKDSVEKIFKKDAAGTTAAVDVTLDDSVLTNTGFTVDFEQEIVSDSNDKQLKVTVSVTVAEVGNNDKATPVSITYNASSDNKATFNESTINGLLSDATLKNYDSLSLTFTPPTSSDASTAGTLTYNSGEVTFTVGSTAPNASTSYTFNASIPASDLDLKPGYAWADSVNGVSVSVTVNGEASADGGQ